MLLTLWIPFQASARERACDTESKLDEAKGELIRMSESITEVREGPE